MRTLAVALICLASVTRAEPLADAARTFFADAKEADRFVTRWRGVGAKQLDPQVRTFVEAQIVRNLQEKQALAAAAGKPFPLSVDEALRTIAGYEAFKFSAFVSSGVFPKRYFGYFDERWDTAAYETILRDTVRACVTVANQQLALEGAKVRITDAEVAVTFIAEGGALLLREKQAEIDQVHPVLGIGLDDIATGFARDSALVAGIDTAADTKLREIVTMTSAGPVLSRYMTFREAIAGTAVMWTFEKKLAAAKLAELGVDLSTLDRDLQFVVGSLVYNSGIAFSDERWRQIRDFATAAYLSKVSDQNATRRWPLPVSPSKEARAKLLESGAYPDQPTSWSGVYHVLQRWGGYAGLQRFTDTFDARGMFRRDAPR